MLRGVLNLGTRAVLAVLALLLGLIAPVYAGPPIIVPAVAIQPAVPDLQPAPVVHVYLIAYRAHAPPVGVLVAYIEGQPHSAVVTLYAYCGGDPINRSDPSGLDWEWVNQTNDDDAGWRWVAGPGEHPQANVPEWAVPGFNWSPGMPSRVTTAHALASRIDPFGSITSPAILALAQQVGQGGVGHWSGEVAMSVYGYYQGNNVSDPVAGLAGYNAWIQAKAASELAARGGAASGWRFDQERFNIIAPELGKAAAGLIPGSGIVEGGMDLNAGHYGAAALSIGSELPWAKVWKAGKRLAAVGTLLVRLESGAVDAARAGRAAMHAIPGLGRLDPGLGGHLAAGSLSRKRGVVGAHDVNAFNGVLTGGGGRIVSSTPHPTLPGVFRHEYEIPKLDAAGKVIPGQFKGFDPKTTFDPRLFTQDEWLRRGGEGANSALNLGRGLRDGRRFEGPDSLGTIWEGWINDAGEVVSVWPKF